MINEELMAKRRTAIEEAYGKGNVDALDEFFASDVILHMSPMPDTKGLEAYKQSVIDSRQLSSDFRFDWQEEICEGDTMAIRLVMRGTHTGTSPTIPVPPTGKEVALKDCVFEYWKDGKIVEFIEYSNYLGLFQQLGIIPPMEQGGQ